MLVSGLVQLCCTHQASEHMGNWEPPGAAAGGWVACLTPLGSTGHLTCSSQHATSPQPPVPNHLVWAGCFLPVLCTILLLIGSARYLCGMEPRTNTPGHSRVWHMVPILMAVQKKKQLTKATSGFRTSVTKMFQCERSRGILLGCCGITITAKHCICFLIHPSTRNFSKDRFARKHKNKA